MTGADKIVRVRIRGRVQGVWFRGWTEREAASRGLSGWVRNRPDGSVEAIFQGPAEAVDAMVAACWHGPRAAMVTSVSVEPTNETPAAGFRQVPGS
jgi:acylphosphatase